MSRTDHPVRGYATIESVDAVATRFGQSSTMGHHKNSAIDEKSLELAHLIDELCPDLVHKSLAHSHLEQCKMSANAAISVNEDEQRKV